MWFLMAIETLAKSEITGASRIAESRRHLVIPVLLGLENPY